MLLSISDAMDLVSPELSRHQQRTAYICWQMANSSGLPKETTEKITIAALLHDIGALSPEEKLDIHKAETINPQKHCLQGEALLNQVPWLKPCAKIVRNHHKGWVKYDVPLDAQGVMESQVVLLADTLERLIDRSKFILHQDQELISRISSLSGQWIHPEVIDLFLSISDREEFWLDLMSPRLYSILMHKGPLKKIELGLTDTLIISELFRNIIDFRSHFTSTHSSGVAACASSLAELIGFTKSEVDLIQIAGYLHDIGKLIVPNKILNKPGKLTKEEFSIIKQHTYYTYMVLDTIGGLEQVTEWAAFHHENLNGTGYPFRINSSEIVTGSRIIAVADIFTALSEERPYRKGMPKEKILSILRKQAEENMLDDKITDVLLENYDSISKRVKDKQREVDKLYASKFSDFVNSEEN